MRCQVSGPVANLLEGAAAEPGSRLLLQSRGRVSIKGKVRCWAQRRALPCLR